MVKEGRGWQREKTPEEKKRAEETNMSENYKGDPGNPRSYSDERLTDAQNCCFWLFNLPPDVIEHDVLGRIQNCGRVASFSMCKGETDIHGHAGAKLVFLTESGAGHFWSRYGLSPGSLIVGGRLVGIRRNRVKIGQRNVPAHHTRCLRVDGPPHVVNQANLLQFFRSKLVFEMDEIIDHTHSDRVSCLEFRFSSYVGQAELAMLALLAEERFTSQPFFRVRHMPDPCA